MLIMTQNKDKIINFNDFSVINWRKSNNNFSIYIAKYGDIIHEVHLGMYRTVADAYIVLELIIRCSDLGNMFIMPSEDEIDKRMEIAKREGLL